MMRVTFADDGNWTRPSPTGEVKSVTAKNPPRSEALPTVIPGEFIAKWHASELKERSAAQEHFIDLCRLLGEPTPVEAGPTCDHYCFERGAPALPPMTALGAWAYSAFRPERKEEVRT